MQICHGLKRLKDGNHDEWPADRRQRWIPATAGEQALKTFGEFSGACGNSALSGTGWRYGRAQ